MTLFIGLMSGTSMDGIDAALVEVDSNRLVAGITQPYSDESKQMLQDVLGRERSSLAELSQLNTMLGREFALAVHQLLDTADVTAECVTAIGSHGQTICHDARATIPYTVQLGCAHTIAESTGIVVVADFRSRDLVVGGQGAPFAPVYHQALFGHGDLPLAVVNIGGISNVSYITDGDGVNGYDVGPGNCLLDSWIQKHLGMPYDANGAWAASGRVIMPLLWALLDDPYFKALPPKSLGKEYFSLAWLSRCIQPHYAVNDVQATLVELTAITIADDIKNSNLLLKRVAFCGGGTHNTFLQTRLKFHLPGLQMGSTQALGVDPDFLEAMMFAWLAEKTLNHTPLDLRQITGAKKSAVLGAIYAAGIDKG
jgi:anhydro-N-acetylmuramic acid kinase